MNKKFSYTYNGKIISFFLSNSKEVMIDATEMALMYSSSPKDYDRLRPSKLRSQEYKDYIDALIKSGQISSINDVIKQVPVQGKRGSGHIWMNRRVAIRYAQWLDPIPLVCEDRRFIFFSLAGNITQ